MPLKFPAGSWICLMTALLDILIADETRSKTPNLRLQALPGMPLESQNLQTWAPDASERKTA